MSGSVARVLVVSASELDAARALAEEGHPVVIVGTPSDALGECVAELERDGHRVATFTGRLDSRADRGALDELVDELFARETPRS